MYKIKRGDKSATVQDYYLEDMPDVTIPLDERLTPGQNAQQYFKKYSKQKRTLEVVTQQIKETEEELEYLLSIEPSIAVCSTDDEIAEVESELIAAGALKQSGRRNKTKTKAAQPLFYEKDGFTIAVGKNNLQNDKLTFRLANGGDLWVHAKDVHGSHVIVFAAFAAYQNRKIGACYTLGRADNFLHARGPVYDIAELIVCYVTLFFK